MNLPEEPYLPKQRADSIKEILDKAMAGDPEAARSLTDRAMSDSSDLIPTLAELMSEAFFGNSVGDGSSIYPTAFYSETHGDNDMKATTPGIVKRGTFLSLNWERVAGIKAPQGRYIQRVPTWAQRVHYLGVKIFFRFAERVIERLDRTPWVSGPGGYEYDPPFLHDFAPRKKFIREEEA